MKLYSLVEALCPSELWLSYSMYGCKVQGTIAVWKILFSYMQHHAHPGNRVLYHDS